MTPSTTKGLNRYWRLSPVAYDQATASCFTFDLLIWLSEEYCEESAPPRYWFQVLKGRRSAAEAVAASADRITHAVRERSIPGSIQDHSSRVGVINESVTVSSPTRKRAMVRSSIETDLSFALPTTSLPMARLPIANAPTANAPTAR